MRVWVWMWMWMRVRPISLTADFGNRSRCVSPNRGVLVFERMCQGIEGFAVADLAESVHRVKTDVDVGVGGSRDQRIDGFVRLQLGERRGRLDADAGI